MSCPNCGTDTLTDQQFCRSCGFGLTGDGPRRFNVQAWGLLALMLIFSGLLIAMGGKLWAVKWVLFSGLIITFVGMFGIAAYGLLRETRTRKSKPKPIAATSSAQPELHRADTTSKLLPVADNDFIPSVVEKTTDLLPAQRGSSRRD